MKIDGTVKKETAYVAIAEAILIAIMLAVYLIISKFTPNVLFAALTSGAVAVLNFFVMDGAKVSSASSQSASASGLRSSDPSNKE